MELFRGVKCFPWTCRLFGLKVFSNVFEYFSEILDLDFSIENLLSSIYFISYEIKINGVCTVPILFSFC